MHRSYEVENLRKYRAGEMSDAELVQNADLLKRVREILTNLE